MRNVNRRKLLSGVAASIAYRALPAGAAAGGAPGIPWSATTRGPRRKLAIAGDSYEANNFTLTTGPHFTLNGTVTALNVLARQAFEVDINKAFFTQSGTGADYLVTRLLDILTYAPDYLVFSAGHNDFIHGNSLATVKANLTTVINACLGAGITPIMCLTPPQNTNQSSGSVTLQQLQRLIVSLNQWKRAYCAAHRLPLWDWYTPMVDASASGGGFAAGMVNAGDNIHPGYKGAMAAAKQGLLDLAGILPPPTTALINNIGDIYDATYSPNGNMYTNPMFYTSGSALSGVLSGTGPASWAISRTSGAAAGGTIAVSLVASADGLGQWCQLAVSGATTGGTTAEQITFLQQINAGAGTYATGDTVEAWMEVNVLANSPFTQIVIQVADNNGVTNNVSIPSAGNQASAGETTGPAYAWTGIVRMPPYTVSAYGGSGTQNLATQINVKWDGSGNNFSGTVQFRRPTLRKSIAA